jgi:hypothetical protein
MLFVELREISPPYWKAAEDKECPRKFPCKENLKAIAGESQLTAP